MKAKEFDARFDKREDLTHILDLSKARRPGQMPKRVNVDFPRWLLAKLDLEADRLGVPRQSLIKVWIAERLTLTKQKRLAEPSAPPNRRPASRSRT